MGAARGGAPPARPRPDWADDRQAFEAVYRDHGRAVHAVAARVGGEGLAADVVQEVFVRLWREPLRFDPGRGTIRAYLVMVARSTTIDRVRSDAARQGREEREERERELPASAAPDAGLLAGDLATTIDEALTRLSASCREAIVTTFYGGVTYREAAEILGAAEGTVKARIRAGLRQLRAELGALR